MTEHAGLDDPLPERVEFGQRERARAVQPGHRRRPDENGARPALDHPVQLVDRLLHDRQGDDGCGEDAALVVELPGLVQPLVQAVNDRVGRLGVVPETFLHQARQRRVHHRLVDALLVH